ncbi:MAG: hypothetical protein ACTTKK_01400 [Ottowia sp.]
MTKPQDASKTDANHEAEMPLCAHSTKDCRELPRLNYSRSQIDRRLKLAPIGPLRDHDWHALRLQQLYQPLNIKRLVRQQRPKLWVPDQFFDSFAVMPLAYGLALSPAPWP